RVSYTGNESTTALAASSDAPASARALRHQLERFHGISDPSVIGLAFAHLGSNDRFIRYAARIALESQDAALWRERALRETNVTAALSALIALVRVDAAETQPALLRALTKFPLDAINEEQTLMKLRALQLSFLRQGRPKDELAQLVTEELKRAFPSKSWLAN